VASLISALNDVPIIEPGGPSASKSVGAKLVQKKCQEFRGILLLCQAGPVVKEARPGEQAWHVDGAPSGASAQATESRGEGTVDGWPASVACPQQSGDGGIKVANVVWVLKEDWVGPQSSIFS